MEPKFKGVIRKEERYDGTYILPVLDIYRDNELITSFGMGEVKVTYKDFIPYVTVELRFDELEIKDSELEIKDSEDV